MSADHWQPGGSVAKLLIGADVDGTAVLRSALARGRQDRPEIGVSRGRAAHVKFERVFSEMQGHINRRAGRVFQRHERLHAAGS